MAWRFSEDRPLWIQLTEIITLKIVSGEYALGSPLPSVRAFAQEAGVNPNTVQRAMAELESQGFIETRRTAGRTVTEDMQLITQKRKQLAFEQINQFMKAMTALGYTWAEVKNLLENWEREEEK